MRIFVYEYVTGGGLLEQGPDQPFPASLLAEGAAMLRALAEDFAAIERVEVVALRDARLPAFQPRGCRMVAVADAGQEKWEFARLAGACEGTIVIAPEMGGALQERVSWVRAVSGRLLSPGPELVALASDKHATAIHLASAGLPVPCGHRWGAGQPWPAELPAPLVVKPCDGAGSQGLRLLEQPPEAGSLPPDRWWRIERYCPGLAASVAVLAGPAGHMILPPCRQLLSDDGTFTYLGGSCPLPPCQSMRAEQIANRVIEALPGAQGYLGIDLVLGHEESGADDVVVEVNPRLTTSYVGLRALVRENLAGAWLALVEGVMPELSFRTDPVEFAADGRIGPAGVGRFLAAE